MLSVPLSFSLTHLQTHRPQAVQMAPLSSGTSQTQSQELKKPCKASFPPFPTPSPFIYTHVELAANVQPDTDLQNSCMTVLHCGTHLETTFILHPRLTVRNPSACFDQPRLNLPHNRHCYYLPPQLGKICHFLRHEYYGRDNSYFAFCQRDLPRKCLQRRNPHMEHADQACFMAVGTSQLDK